uniref:Cryptochrome DASH n=1 Tax=Cannabis sativa TaxID=3483 RepID=A0A803PB08_CANSA
MAISLLQLTPVSFPYFIRNSHPKLNSRTSILVHFVKSNPMSSGSDPGPVRRASSAKIFKVPDLETDQVDLIADQSFQRYFLSSSTRRRSGNGVAVVWFRNDLRVLDNEALYKAWVSSESVLPVYCVDPRLFGATHYFGFPKTGGTKMQAVESKCSIRGCIKMPASLGPPPPSIGDWGCIPSTESLGLSSQDVSKGMKFVGGESAALSRVYEYFWKKDLLKKYKETRNGMLGPDYSTKFSPWLASGSVSPRLIHEEVKRYEKERLANDSTYWVLFELIWRDYFRFLSVKYGNALFHLGGPRNVEKRWSQDIKLFESWRDGTTGYPIIDANMKELATTGFMSNRGRQIVCSFLVRDMGIDWRMGAEWFETCLLDYDPCSNYGNWTYGAGVGNDPREDRYFSIPKQAQTYDPEGEYAAYWLPQLQSLPKDKRNFPGKLYIEQIVPLKFGSTATTRNQGRYMASARKGNLGHRGQRR